MRKATVRLAFSNNRQAEGVTVDLADDEHVIGADHEGGHWWVYICREYDEGQDDHAAD